MKTKVKSFLDFWVQESEKPMLALAFLAVLIYMVDLLGGWHSLGIENYYKVIAFLIDVTFVLDLLFKIWALGKIYISSPWFVVDFIAALPILGWINMVQNPLEALRFIRGIRLFRALRTLRILQVIPVVRINTQQKPTVEATKFLFAMRILIPLYTLLFVVIVYSIYYFFQTEGEIIEFYLVLGSLLGMILVIAVVRYLLPAIMSVQVHRLLNVALPQQVADFYLRHPESYSHTVKMPASILFCDIKSFTTTVEKLGNNLDVLKSHLEKVMDVVTDIHRQYDLIIDKFIGDAIMSFRGGDLVEGDASEHAWRVVRAAIEGHKAMRALNDPYFHDMRIGGASSKGVLIGAFGTTSRLSYTVLGDRVNIAARLEAAVKQCGTKNLFDDETYALLKDRKDLIWRRFGRISVEGRLESLNIYEVFDVHDLQDASWIETYHTALSDFEMHRFSEAKRGFEKVKTHRLGGDVPSSNYIDFCQYLINNPPALSWVPIFTTYK